MARTKIENDFLPPCQLCEFRFWEQLYYSTIQRLPVSAGIPDSLVDHYLDAKWPYDFSMLNVCSLCKSICRRRLEQELSFNLQSVNPARRTRPVVNKHSRYEDYAETTDKDLS